MLFRIASARDANQEQSIAMFLPASPTKRRVPVDNKDRTAANNMRCRCSRGGIPGSLHRVRCHEQFPNPIHKFAVGILFKLLLHPARDIFAILHGRPPGCEMSLGSLSPFPSEYHKRNSPIIATCDDAAPKSPRKVIVALGRPVPCAQVFLRFSRTFFFRKSITPGSFERLLCTPEWQ